MDAGVYKVDSWGEFVGTGVTDARWVTFSGIAKIESPDFPFLVANEFVCARLALMLGLPVPPGVVVPSDGGGRAYVSMRFGLSGERPPRGNAIHLAQDLPVVATGVAVFDSWVANPDREANFAYTRGKIDAMIFDHSHALLGNDGISRLFDIEENSIVEGGIAEALSTSAYIDRWCDRVKALHDDSVADVCLSLARNGALTNDQANETAEFLNRRKVKLRELLDGSREMFHAIDDWGQR